ncbi:MAG: thiamine-phosphate pyrophosphorylase [Wolinella sp.]
MSKESRGVERVIDASLNRLREGLRVIEDVVRYTRDDSDLSSRLKSLRHSSRLKIHLPLVSYRDILGDVSKASSKDELVRENLESILVANFKRTQESARTLEEILKLVDIGESIRFKAIRYELYELERILFLRFGLADS